MSKFIVTYTPYFKKIVIKELYEVDKNVVVVPPIVDDLTLLEQGGDHNKGCEIKEVMADCSTQQGQKITQRFLKLKPFMETSHNSIIHILSGEEFVKLLNK